MRKCGSNIEPTPSQQVEKPVITLHQNGNSTLTSSELADRATIFAGNLTELQWSEISRYLLQNRNKIKKILKSNGLSKELKITQIKGGLLK
jgi:hypothetical protein